MLGNETLFNNIKNLCEQNNTNITKLEKELNFGGGIISRWGKNVDPSLIKIMQIANYFNVSLDDIIGKSNFTSDDEFLKYLLQETLNKNLSWKLANEDRPHNGFHYSILSEEGDEVVCTERAYSAFFEEGIITIIAVCEPNNSIHPHQLFLHIKPSANIGHIGQNYEVKSLMRLWIAVLKNTNDDIPIDASVEIFKQSFIQKAKSSEIKEEEERFSFDAPVLNLDSFLAIEDEEYDE